MAQAVEAVTTHAPLARPLPRHRVDSGSLGQGCMEGSVKGRYLGNPWQSLLHRSNAVETGWVVERSQLCQFFNRLLDLSRDKHSGRVSLAAVDNAMSHSSEVFKGVQSCRWASLQIFEDSSCGISVFLQLQLLADFRPVCLAEN